MESCSVSSGISQMVDVDAVARMRCRACRSAAMKELHTPLGGLNPSSPATVKKIKVEERALQPW